jgi:hypothetical protein
LRGHICIDPADAPTEIIPPSDIMSLRPQFSTRALADLKKIEFKVESTIEAVYRLVKRD